MKISFFEKKQQKCILFNIMILRVLDKMKIVHKKVNAKIQRKDSTAYSFLPIISEKHQMLKCEKVVFVANSELFCTYWLFNMIKIVIFLKFDVRVSILKCFIKHFAKRYNLLIRKNKKKSFELFSQMNYYCFCRKKYF